MRLGFLDRQASRRALGLVAVASLALVPGALAAEGRCGITDVPRVVAVGDVHAPYDNLVSVLTMAGLLDRSGHWAGGKGVFVQVGDILDRGVEARQPSLAGWWLGSVSLPLFQFLVLRWYFRLFIWARFLWQVSRIELKLTPLNPDKCGGLGFLGLVSEMFAPLLLAQGTLLAGGMANRIFYAGAGPRDAQGGQVRSAAKSSPVEGW